jgi:2',3'-cyclic-nucleotide 2'-phosphodiesterase (5'-nucleotidase family)
MNEVLSYSDNEYKKTEGALNTAIGNLMADAVFEQSSPIFKKRYNLDLDLVLLNHGGIRAPLPKGPIFTKTAFNIMPFENKVVVAQLKGNVVMELVDYLIKAKRAHPISGMTLHITKNGKVKKPEIQGKTIDLNKIYNVATSDYLFNGGDRMEFFKKNKTVFDLDYKIRAILIDYFSAQDTLNPKRDQRFIYTN